MNSKMIGQVSPGFLAGGGEMGQYIRDYDWSCTPLGPAELWPQSLRTCVRIMLTSRQPMWIGWGRELIKLYNDPYKAIVGGKHPWALGKPASLVWKDIWRDIEPMLQTVMQRDEGTYVESQLLIMERNGYPEETYYTFSYTPIPGDDGQTAGMICANTDDTDRIISQRQLRTLTQLGKRLTDVKSNEEVISKTIQTLTENPYDFPFAVFRILKNNKAVKVMTTPMGDAAAMVNTEVDLDADDGIAVTLRRALTTRQLQIFENKTMKLGKMPKGAWEIQPKTAIVLPIAQTGVRDPYGSITIGMNPYRLLDEKYRSFFELVADQVATSFSDVRVLEEERKRAQALAEIDRAKTTFFSNISHEFRTPLTLLQGPIEDVMHSAKDDETRIKLEVAYRNAIRMQKLVNTLLEFSRIEAGRVEGRFQRVDIGTLTEDLASTFRSAIEKAGMQLIIHRGPVTDEVYVDIDMWERIILNLVSNAFKYSHQGMIEVSIQQVGHEVQVAVKDTGLGIPEDQLDKIFNRFHRVENTAGRSQEGTGIGLAMVKELVKLHQGSIQVSSSPGRGSVFTVCIPVKAGHLPPDRIVQAGTVEPVFRHSTAFVEEALKWLPETAKHAAETLPIPAFDDKPSVLIADDNADMRDYVQRLLSDQFTVYTAVDGEEAFKKALENKPDLVLTDVMMPKLDGFGLLRKIRNRAETKYTPIIFLSARAGEEAKVEGLDAGADDYLVKPFSAKELIVRVSNHIRINQVRRETEHQFYQLFLQAPAIINLVRGPEFRYELFHPKNKEIFGDVDFTGMTIREAFPELEGQGIFEMLEDVYRNGRSIYQNERHIVFKSKTGEPIDAYLNFIYQPWYDVRGNIQGIMSFANDVTEIVKSRQKIEESEKKYRELSQQLELMVEKRTGELLRSNNDLQQFAHVASHDLKEPVRKFRIFIDRLEDEYGQLLPEKGRLYLQKMKQASNRMSSMIEGVLRYSSMNISDQNITVVDLDQIVDTIQTDLELTIQQKNATIHKSRLPVLDGAHVLLYQLFYNLIYNALKFSKKEQPCQIHIGSETIYENGMDYAKIAISDNGIGFEPAYADVIFDTFTRLNPKDEYEGTGLGLALCKKIVERHHGRIIAAGEKNKGACFTLWLPFTQTEKSI
jgi:Bacteriophytochrome (light-regulated signal transduction histidine kinase)